MLYPEIQPYASGLLDVGQGHTVYWEQCGNPAGQPLVFLHGGPGGGCSERSRRLFDPARYRVLLFDQRGCGRSTPHAATHDNDCAHLVQDMERLRQLLQIERWMIYGGSWGCTLALAYTQLHRERVQGLVLRGVFTAQQQEIDWLYRSAGAAKLFPEAWHAFATALGPLAGDDLLQAYAARLNDADPARQQAAAMAWCQWERGLISLHAEPKPAELNPQHCLAMARISAHILSSDPWLGRSGFIWPANYLQGIPGILVQGRFDMVTPAHTAWRLHREWRGSELRIVHDAGHASSDPALQDGLVRAFDDMLELAER
jgi:proline iminopeptidase